MTGDCVLRTTDIKLQGQTVSSALSVGFLLVELITNKQLSKGGHSLKDGFILKNLFEIQ